MTDAQEPVARDGRDPKDPREAKDPKEVKPEQAILLQLARPFLTPNEILHLHSHTISDNKKLIYNQRKYLVYQFVFQVIRHFKFPLRVLGTTMNYFQRFYLFNRFEDVNPGDIVTAQMNKNLTLLQLSDFELIKDMEKDPHVVAMACLFLATKNEECIKKLKEIQTVSNRIREQENSNEERNLDRQRRAILAIEFKLLQITKFDLNNGLPFELLDVLVTQFCKQLGVDYKGLFYAWLVAFDIMLTPLPLTIPAHCIAIAIITITLYINPQEVSTQHNSVGPSVRNYDDILDDLNYEDFCCPQLLVSEAILYVLDYYVNQMNYSILSKYMPAIDVETGKEQVFKFMALKHRLNDLEVIDQFSCLTKELLDDDPYLTMFDYLVGAKGCARFLMGNKRKRFNHERHFIAQRERLAKKADEDKHRSGDDGASEPSRAPATEGIAPPLGPAKLPSGPARAPLGPAKPPLGPRDLRPPPRGPKQPRYRDPHDDPVDNPRYSLDKPRYPLDKPRYPLEPRYSLDKPHYSMENRRYSGESSRYPREPSRYPPKRRHGDDGSREPPAKRRPDDDYRDLRYRSEDDQRDYRDLRYRSEDEQRDSRSGPDDDDRRSPSYT